MKWIPKMISCCIVLILVAGKVMSPPDTLMKELVYDLLLVFFLLGLGESLLVLSWLKLTQKSFQLFSTSKLKNI